MFEDSHHINDTFVYGGKEYICTNLVISIPYLIVLVTACIIGICGNIAALLTIIFNERLHQPQTAFLVSLGLADLLVTTIGDPISIMGKYMTKCIIE